MPIVVRDAPEATWVNERLLENGAREIGIDVVEMRKRNLIQRSQFSLQDTGRAAPTIPENPPLLLEKLVALAKYRELRAEQKRLRAKGVLMGIGNRCLPRQVGHRPKQAAVYNAGGLHGGFEVRHGASSQRWPR